ncbi:MAG TPA: imidazole glycerol phosphate synthase subunit HisH [Candidatus Sulfomarinibacteraceae bacterium]|nr:imidazole glycerol phosphate synthase subunit HisH [Candidatus Sulfomarinibacteraceae bacterium]
MNRGGPRGGLRVAIVDYGAGNLVSIEQAMTSVGAEVRVATGPGDLEGAEAVIVPGVGAAAPAMRRLARAGLVDPLLRWIALGRPYLGICLGLQLLFDGSDEDGAATFGVIPGRTVQLERTPTLPHIGWNQVEQRREHAIFSGIADGTDLYFVHSYAGRPEGVSADAVTLAETEHGGRFVSAVDRGNVLGVQFHPERSGGAGLRLLANFTRWATALAAGSGAERSPVGAGGTSGGD